MNLRTAVLVLLTALVAVAAWPQAVTEPPGDPPMPAMVVDGHTMAPAEWAGDLTGETVTINAIPMMYVGKAAREAGRTIMFADAPEGTVLSIRVGLRSIDFLLLPPGEFWRHPWVRYLIAQANIYQLQPMPYWPYAEANIPARPPHHISPRWPFLVWRPDEEWLLLEIEPAPVDPEDVAPELRVPIEVPDVPDVPDVDAPPPPEPDMMDEPPMEDPMMDEPPPM